jgi:hypothetical protein
MDEWTVIAYGAFGLSAAASLLQVGNWLSHANPQAIVNAGRWSLVGLGVTAAAVLLWLTASGRWTLALMLASFMMPVFVHGAPRWRTVLGPLPILKNLWPASGASFGGGVHAAARGVDRRLVEQSLAVLRAYLDQAGRPDATDRDSAGHRAMSAAEALDTLGLDPGAQPDQIREAHRRLEQRVDPAFGGTQYLADKIDEAKRVLLGRL